VGIATPILKEVLGTLKNANIALKLIQFKREDALRTLSCCCSYRSGEYKGRRWSSSEKGLLVGKTFYPWGTIRETALQGLAGDMLVGAELTFTFDRADHPRWKTHHPYSRLTTEASIQEEISRSKSWTRR